MSTLLPQDSDNNPIPALRLKAGGAHSIVAGESSVRNATAFADTTRVVSLYADVPVYITCGDASVTASTSDHYFPAGVYYDIAIGGDRTGHASHIAVLAIGTPGTLYVSEKE